MKKLNKYILIGLLAIAPIVYVGCGSTPIATANNTNAIIITSVNTGMTAWSSYVASGKATQQQVDAVKAAYNTYYNAELILKAALMTAITSTNGIDLSKQTVDMQNAEVALLNILNQYLNNK